ncbi:MAG: tetratricopeptide repeat protein [Spirochaetales bacterium]|nr:tetratricopeptide repeat protein [Spirochaetales bacterium]
MKKSAFFNLLILLVWCETFAVDSYSQARSLYETGELAFSNRQYEAAINIFSEVETFLVLRPEFKPFFDHHYRGFSMVEMVKAHQALGDFTPEYNYQMLVFYVGSTDATIFGNQIKAEFTDDLIKKAEISQMIASMFVEVLSHGRLSISYRRIFLDSKLTRLDTAGYSEELPQIVQARFEAVEPFPTQAIYQSLESTDGYLLYWNDNNFKIDKKAHAGALGGAVEVPIVPFQLNGPRRGRIIISASLLNRPGTLLHEFFHSIEARLGISPIHGFSQENRKFFPEWAGSSEFSYYVYHFERILEENLLPAIEFRSFSSQISAELVESNLAYADSVPFSKRLQAHERFVEASRLRMSSRDYLSRFDEVLLQNPYHAGSLFYKGRFFMEKKDYQLALALFSAAYQINPTITGLCYYLGVTHYNLRNFDKSIEFLSQAIFQSPLAANYYQYRGFVYYQTGNYEGAFEDFSMMVDLNPTFTVWLAGYLETKILSGDENAYNLKVRLSL